MTTNTFLKNSPNSKKQKYWEKIWHKTSGTYQVLCYWCYNQVFSDKEFSSLSTGELTKKTFFFFYPKHMHMCSQSHTFQHIHNQIYHSMKFPLPLSYPNPVMMPVVIPSKLGDASVASPLPSSVWLFQDSLLYQLVPMRGTHKLCRRNSVQNRDFPSSP